MFNHIWANLSVTQIISVLLFTCDYSCRKLSNRNRYVNGVQKNEDRITVDGVSKENEDGTRRIGQLIISNVIRSDDGLYECIAKNKVFLFFYFFKKSLLNYHHICKV